MKLLKLIPVAAIVLTAFTTFEAKAGYPSGWTKKNGCTNLWGSRFYKLQKTDTPAAYGVYSDNDNEWVNPGVNKDWEAAYISYKCATEVYKESCDRETLADANFDSDCDEFY